MDYSKLRGRIREKFGTESAFASAMEMHQSTLGRKLNGQSEWNRAEIVRACLLLDIDLQDAPAYFFAVCVA